MGYAIKIILLLLLLLLGSATLPINASKNKDDDFNRCKAIVKTWSSSSLALEVKEDKHLLQDLLFFLHIPRTGGRTYFHCFLRKLYASSLECPRSYDKLRLDPSKPNCRLLTTHDDYSVVSKLHRERTSVVTILRNPVDRVFSTYEFSVEVAARFLVHPNLTSVTRMSKRVRSKAGVSTLDIWPWKYLVPWMREDLFARRDARKHMSHTDTRSNDSYDMEELVMPLQEYINDPVARDIIHNGATFQIAGLTNNSYLPGAHVIRRCVLKHHVLGEHVLAVAKKRLDNMLYVGLTEDHKESATMFANVVGAQVISQLTASNNARASTVNNRSGESSLSDSRTSSSDFVSSESYHRNSSTHKNVSKISSAEPAESMTGNMTVGKLIKAYETCISNLRDTQSQRRTASLKRISPVNFSKEARRQIPEVLLQEIQSLNSLDMKLYKYAQDIFSNQHKHMTQKLSKSDDLEITSTHSNIVSKSQEKKGNIYGNFLTAPAWNNLWIAICIVFSVLVIALFVNARRRTSKLKI